MKNICGGSYKFVGPWKILETGLLTDPIPLYVPLTQFCNLGNHLHCFLIDDLLFNLYVDLRITEVPQWQWWGRIALLSQVTGDWGCICRLSLLTFRRFMKSTYKCRDLAKYFVVAGTASESLYGACESMFRPDMEAEESFETISQTLLSSVDRECLSGLGGPVYLATPDEVTERIHPSLE